MPDTGNVPIQILQGGSVLQVASGGTINILAGGSIQNAGGVSLSGNVSASSLTLGGTLGKWSFGTVGLTSGIGTVATGLTRVLSANANTILGENQSNGSAAFVLIDLSLSGAGSVIYRLGSVGGALWASGGTISWQAFGT